MARTRSISLSVKLVGAFLVTASLVVFVSYFNLRAVGHIHDGFGAIIDTDVPRLNILQEMRALSSEIALDTEGYQTETDTTTSASHKAQLLASLRSLTDKQNNLQSLALGASNAEGGDGVDLRSVIAAKDRVTAATDALVALKEQKGAVPAAMAADLESQEKAMDDAIAAAITQQLKAISDQDAAIDAQIDQVTRGAVLFTVLSALFAAALGLVISLGLARNLRRVKDGAVRIANGDFSAPVQVSSRDEIGELATVFNQMSARMKEAYQRLALEKERDEAILQSMGEGLIAVDESGRIALINQVAATLLVLSDRNAVIGQPIQGVYQLYNQSGKDDTPLAPEQRPVLVALQTGQPVSDVFLFKSPDGGKRLLHISASAVKLGDKVGGAIMVLRDVTKEKEVDRMKTEFISLASHQLRTPLSAIKWFTEMLVSGDAGQLQPEQLDFAKNISDSTERMIALVNALLNISRIESGRIMVDPKPTDLKQLVTGIINDLKAKTEEKQQSLIISVHADLPQIMLDPRLIGQVYLNLLTNAVKYTPKGGEISVFISKKDDQIISQVSDNGYGIPKDQHARIFQKFFRAANAVKVETDGTGLGLYLIKAIIESSGGKIWFESEEGKGSTFWFSIPVSGMQAKEGEVTLDV